VAQPLDVLRGGVDLDPRQQTLRATVAWSVELLDEPEQRLLARLAVFAGGWSLDAAEHVCGAELDTLSSLVDQSLVGRAGDRYGMLETIRQFAEEQLTARGEHPDLRRRHLAFFTGLAESLGFTPEAIEAGRRQRHDVATAEAGNVRAALGWAVEDDPVLGLRLATALESFWVSHSPFEAKRLFAELAGRADDVPPPLAALVTRCRANLAYMTGDLEEAMALYREAARLYRELRDEHGLAVVENRMGTNLLTAGHDDEACRLLESSLERSKEHGFRINEAMVVGSLGAFHCRRGRPEQGFELMQRALALAQEASFSWWEANLRNALATHAAELGRDAEAEVHARAQLALGRDMSDRRHTLQALGVLAALAAGRGDAERAARLWGALEAEELRGPVGLRPRMAPWSTERARFAAAVVGAADAAFEQRRAEGRRMELRDAVAYATETNASATGGSH
jgi:non-specific serine/threonine protein kinase